MAGKKATSKPQGKLPIPIPVPASVPARCVEDLLSDEETEPRTAKFVGVVIPIPRKGKASADRVVPRRSERIAAKSHAKDSSNDVAPSPEKKPRARSLTASTGGDKADIVAYPKPAPRARAKTEAGRNRAVTRSMVAGERIHADKAMVKNLIEALQYVLK
jgi:hypothetical protein